MNILRLLAMVTIAVAALKANASIVSQTDPQLGGIGYRWTVTLENDDSASVTRHVGAWAWEDSSLFTSGEVPVGWTHNSDWIALRLEGDSYVTFVLSNADGVPLLPSGTAGNNLYPGMTIYSGWDNDLAPQAFADAHNNGEPVDNWHSYVNRNDIEWAEDTQYFAHLEPNGMHSVETTLWMEAGDYTIAVGGKSISAAAEGRQGYVASIATTAVPEPGSALAMLLGGSIILSRCQRKRIARVGIRYIAQPVRPARTSTAGRMV